MFLFGCASLASQSTDPAMTFDTLVAEYETFSRAQDPISAAAEGDADALSKLPDISRAAELRRAEAARDFRERLDALDPAALAESRRVDHGFLVHVLDREIEATVHDGGRLAFDAEGGPNGWLSYLGSTTRIASRADADAYLARLAAFPHLFADTTDNARRGIKTGFTQPRSVVESAIAVMRKENAVPLDEDAALKPLTVLPASMPAAEQEALRAQARAIVVERIAPARAAFLSFVETEYLPAARPGLGIGSVPGGRDFYAFQARGYTTTSLTPDEIHAIGAAEVARIRARMQAVMAEAGWTGAFADFLAFLRSEPQFYASSRAALLEKASEIAKRADQQLPSLFRASLPRLPYGVAPVPQEIEERYTTGRYSPGSLARGVAGRYLVNTGRLDQRPLYELPALTLHEAVPGHHLQIAIQEELGALPFFRRNANVTAFTEGWGLYAEFLGEEMGIYRTPYERFGRLSYEMWRACRLVADTGIHWMGWSLEEARACFRDNSALSPHNIETELQRYVGWPGQALAYKVGELRFKALRAKAEAALGSRFDVRAFHDAVLMGGPLPLDLLEQRVDVWIAVGGPPAG
jgi:uncharacterized protein (DUF885 family)